jgi:hypothetical protein
MKKMMMTLTAVFCCAMAMSVFTSCSKSDDNGSSGASGTLVAPDTTPVSMKFAYLVAVSPDLIKYADVEVNYLDDSGNVKSEKITSSDTWSKSFTIKIPHKMAVKLQLKKKNDIDYSSLTDDIIVSFGTIIDRDYTLYNKAGDKLNELHNTLVVKNVDFKGSKIEKYIEGLGKDKDAIIYEYDANAKETTTKGAW